MHVWIGLGVIGINPCMTFFAIMGKATGNSVLSLGPIHNSELLMYIVMIEI